MRLAPSTSSSIKLEPVKKQRLAVVRTSKQKQKKEVLASCAHFRTRASNKLFTDHVNIWVLTLKWNQRSCNVASPGYTPAASSWLQAAGPTHPERSARIMPGTCETHVRLRPYTPFPTPVLVNAILQRRQKPGTLLTGQALNMFPADPTCTHMQNETT